MMEPTMIRCSRCSALVALQDATRCGRHDTEPLCGFCWNHHREARNSDIPGGVALDVSRCWAEVGTLDWR